MMDVGKHVIVDFTIKKEGRFNPNVNNTEHLIDPFRFQASLHGALEAIGATVLNIHIARFEGKEGQDAGFSLNFSLSESHATVHTWPEHLGASMDIYTCGNCDPETCWEIFRKDLESEGILIDQYNYQVLGRRLP